MLNLIDSKLSLSGLSKYQLVDALQEIVGQQNYEFLDKKYYDILKNRKKLGDEVKTAPAGCRLYMVS